MPTEIRPLEPLELAMRPNAGEVPSWVRYVVTLAVLLTVVIAAIGPWSLWWLPPFDELWARHTLVGVVSIALGVLVVRRYRASRFVHVAATLPGLHAAGGLIAWGAFAMSSFDRRELANAAPLMLRLPMSHAFVAFVLAALGTALVIARPRQREQLHAFVAVSLVHLLAFGLWLPFATKFFHAGLSYHRNEFGDHVRAVTDMHVAITLLPPFVLACLVAALVMRVPALMWRARFAIAAVAVVGFVAACFARHDMSMRERFIAGNYQHVVLVLGLVAALSLVALAIASALQRRRHAGHAGTIVDDGEPVVGYVHVASWLRGPRLVVREFELETARGPTLVPSGRLLWRMPLLTSVLRAGEAVVVLRTGDRARVSGFVTAGGDHPFRISDAMVVGSSGIEVTPEGDETDRWTHAALVVWRPCVAYLLILIAVGASSLISAAAQF